MRDGLRNLIGKRIVFRATFERRGKKPRGLVGYAETVLFSNVKDNATGRLLCEHVWLSLTKEFENAALFKGDTVKFTARVTYYQKAIARVDLQLSNPTKVMNLTHPQEQANCQPPKPIARPQDDWAGGASGGGQQAEREARAAEWMQLFDELDETDRHILRCQALLFAQSQHGQA